MHDPLHVTESLLLVGWEPVKLVPRVLGVIGELVQDVRTVLLSASQRRRQLGPVADESPGEHSFGVGHFSLHHGIS